MNWSKTDIVQAEIIQFILIGYLYTVYSQMQTLR